MKRLHVNVIARFSVFVLLSGLVLTLGGCRGGAGSDCLTDSDCNLGLLCLKRTKAIDGETYEERVGTCFRDADDDGIPNDGDLSGSSSDRRCGVRALVDPDTGAEAVYETVVGNCDDNCIDVPNFFKARRFVCFAKDDCCPISADRKAKLTRFDLCEDVTDDQDTCAACFSGASPTPPTCYNAVPGGLQVDENGCLHCRAQEQIACANTAECVAMMPTPACSGAWQCTSPVGGYCKFTPEMTEVQDAGGFTQVYQLDSDWDGLGDTCDNCKWTPNGINCDDPAFELRCDVNQDGVVSSLEKLMGNQANEDGDRFGDACDLCPGLTSDDNTDLDNDGLANPCDSDDDGDGIPDGVDNCPLVSNQNQDDLDTDGKGDACDVDADGDGVREDGDGSGVAGDHPCVGGANRQCDDNCPGLANGDQADADGDGIGDACE